MIALSNTEINQLAMTLITASTELIKQKESRSTYIAGIKTLAFETYIDDEVVQVQIIIARDESKFIVNHSPFIQL